MTGCATRFRRHYGLNAKDFVVERRFFLSLFLHALGVGTKSNEFRARCVETSLVVTKDYCGTQADHNGSIAYCARPQDSSLRSHPASTCNCRLTCGVVMDASEKRVKKRFDFRFFYDDETLALPAERLFFGGMRRLHRKRFRALLSRRLPIVPESWSRWSHTRTSQTKANLIAWLCLFVIKFRNEYWFRQNIPLVPAPTEPHTCSYADAVWCGFRVCEFDLFAESC